MGVNGLRQPRWLVWAFYVVVSGIIAHFGVTESAHAAKVPLTILHTNDIHSHYRPDKGPFGLGGIARIATTIRRVRSAVPNTLLLDGGDWSEGHIYYNLGAGRTAIEMMNVLGYDAAVVGNHDWLNGPDHLLRVLGQVPPRFQLLSNNLDFSPYARGSELARYIKPYQIVKSGGAKIGIIGVSTYELIYDKYFAPVKILDPFGVTRKLAAKLKEEEGVDLVVVVSHNGMSTNKLLAGLANVDIVIHAHDHVKLPQPIVVDRKGKKALMVEAHHWGFYVGRLDIVIDTDKNSFELKNYELIQQDKTVPEDPAVLALVNNYDRQLEQRYGDIFQDHLAESKIHLRRETSESLYGNLLTDAYREFTGADVSFEQMSLTSGEIYKGPVHSADVFNALAQIYSPITGKTWTVKTMRMKGETLTWMMNLILSISSYIPGKMISVSGMHAIYDPMRMNQANLDGEITNLATDVVNLDGNLLQQQQDDNRGPLKSLEIGGKPVDPRKSYLVAVPEGINEAIQFIEEFLGNKIERTDIRDTGVEQWRVLAEYMEKNSPIDSSMISRGGRFTPMQADVALYHDDVELERMGSQVRARLTLRNMGSIASIKRQMLVTYDETPSYIVDDPKPADTQKIYTIPVIGPGQTVSMTVDLELPEAIAGERVPLYFILEGSGDDPNTSNDGTWVLTDREGAIAPGKPLMTHGQGMAEHHHHHH